MPGNPLTDPNWAPTIVDTIDRVVAKVRTTATDNAVKASRAVVFGTLALLAVLVALPLLVILVLGIIRELLGFLVDHDTAVYLSYFVLGVILMIGGFVALSMRHKGETA
jgi:uncharacterized membrane protein